MRASKQAVHHAVYSHIVATPCFVFPLLPSLEAIDPPSPPPLLGSTADFVITS